MYPPTYAPRPATNHAQQCELGHSFLAASNHPRDRYDSPLCPHCASAALAEAERCKDRMLAAILDVPEAHQPGDHLVALRQGWKRAHNARFC